MPVRKQIPNLPIFGLSYREPHVKARRGVSSQWFRQPTRGPQSSSRDTQSPPFQSFTNPGLAADPNDRFRVARQIAAGVPTGPVLSSTGQLIPPEQALIHAISEPVDRVISKAEELPGRIWDVANTPSADLVFGEGKTRRALVGNVDGMIAAAQRELDQRAARGEQIGYWDALKTVGSLGAGRSAADVVAGFTSPLSIATAGLGLLARGAKAAQTLRSGLSELNMFGRTANTIQRTAPVVNKGLAASAPALRNAQTAASGVFGAKGAYDAGKNAPAALQGNPAALERMLGGLWTSALGGAGIADRFRLAHVPVRDLPNEVLPANTSVVASNYTGPGLSHQDAVRSLLKPDFLKAISDGKDVSPFYKTKIKATDTSVGSYKGGIEPSFKYRVRGDAVDEFAEHLADINKQQAALRFRYDREGKDVEYTFKNVRDPENALETLQEKFGTDARVEGDNIVIVDENKSRQSSLAAMAKAIGTKSYQQRFGNAKFVRPKRPNLEDAK